MIDFKEVKAIPISQVLGRYGVQLKFKGDYGSCVCPLPSHKPGDKGRNFSVNVKQNYWRCFSDSCNAQNGGKKGGDVINLVALMENCRESEAAQKLATWYGQTKTPQHIAKGPERSETSQKDSQNNNPPSDSVKVGYMQAVGLWFDTFIVRRPDEADDAYYKRVKKGVMSQLHRSYLNGKTGQEVLAT